MKNLLILVAVLLASSSIKAQEINDEIVDLAKIYRNFMFRNAPTSTTFKQLDNISSEALAGSVQFVREAITTNNKLSSKAFLTVPDEQTMLNLYIIRRVSWNLREELPRDNNEVISEIQSKGLGRYELIDSYYDMLFAGVGNKNRPFDLSKVNLELFDYGLQDDTEKGILFLKTMDLCGKTIWGYMNIVNPPNYKKALENIEKYPKFNGQPYYQYLDFGFEDFELVIEEKRGKESFKSYYMSKYYDTLLYHLACLGTKKKLKSTREDLILGSILKEKAYYKFSDKREVLESLFSTRDR